MKDPKNPNRWTNAEISENPQGYLAAQEAFREDQAAARAQEAERRDREHFEQAFVAAGGTRTGAADAWREQRDERAAEAARQADEVARGVQRGATMRAV